MYNKKNVYLHKKTLKKHVTAVFVIRRKNVVSCQNN